MKVETNSPTRERTQRTSRKMLSADDWAFQWNIDPNTARSMAYRGIPKVKNSESVNTTSSQCPLRTCIPPGKIEKKGVVMVAVPKKKKPKILMMQVTKAPIMDMAISPPIQINMNLKSPRNILPMLRQIEFFFFYGSFDIVDSGCFTSHFEFLRGCAGFGNTYPKQQIYPYR